MVHFIGVGKGSADLITLRGAKMLKEGDIVIYSHSLIEKQMVKKMRKLSVKYNADDMTIENIIAVIREAEWAKMTTVILTPEEPSPECEMSKQMDELDKNGINYDFIPGVYPTRRFEFD